MEVLTTNCDAPNLRVLLRWVVHLESSTLTVQAKSETDFLLKVMIGHCVRSTDPLINSSEQNPNWRNFIQGDSATRSNVTPVAEIHDYSEAHEQLGIRSGPTLRSEVSTYLINDITDTADEIDQIPTDRTQFGLTEML